MRLLRVIPVAFATLCMLFFPGLLEARDATTTAAVWTYQILPVDTSVYIIRYCYIA